MADPEENSDLTVPPAQVLDKKPALPEPTAPDEEEAKAADDAEAQSALPLARQKLTQREEEPVSSDSEPVVLAAWKQENLLEPMNISDEAPQPLEKNSFTAALAQVYANHPQLRAQRAGLRATDEGVAQAVSGFRPTVIANYSQGRERDNIDHQGWFYDKTRERTLDVTQPIFNGGGTIASLSSAKSRVSAGRAQLLALEQQVLFSAVAAYTNVIGKTSILEASRANSRILGGQIDATRSRFKAGDLTKTDVAQAQARSASASATERQALADLVEARANFRRVMGYDPSSGLRMPPIPPGLPTSEAQAIEWAHNAEPTLEAARQLERAAESDIDVNTAALLPTVNLQGTLDRSNGLSTTGGFGPRQVNTDAIKVNITIPIYQSGIEWSRVRAARDLAQQAYFTTIDTHYSVTEAASRAWEDYQAAKALIVANQQAVRAAEGAVSGVRQESMYGVRTVLDVLNTEQDLFSARVNLINARVNERQAAYRLLAAVGKLTARHLGLPVTLENPKQHYQQVKFQPIGF